MLQIQDVVSQIFVSYRRDDTQEIAGRMIDRLRTEFGASSIIFDLDSVPFGDDFRTYLTKAIEGCVALLALIGRVWAGMRSDGGTRIEKPDDFVRLEIETALERGTLVVPVLVGSTRMPRPDELPPTLTKLVHLNAASIDPGRDFHVHMGRLVERLKELGARSQQDPNGAFDTLVIPAADRAHLATLDLAFRPFAERHRSSDTSVRRSALANATRWLAGYRQKWDMPEKVFELYTIVCLESGRVMPLYEFRHPSRGADFVARYPDYALDYAAWINLSAVDQA